MHAASAAAELAAATPPVVPVVSLPLGVDASVFFTDESGSAGSGGKLFVVGGVKTREPGHLLREVKAVRDKHRFFDELKFTGITRNSLPIYADLVQVLAHSDARIVAFVIDKSIRDPFAGVADWDARANVTSQLVIGNTNRAEVATLLMDVCSTPRGIAIEEVVRRKVNDRFGATNLISSVSLDSKASDGLQLADLVASAIAYDRRARQSKSVPGAPKAIVARTLATGFGLADLGDHRSGRVNILTSRRGGGARTNVATTRRRTA